MFTSLRKTNFRLIPNFSVHTRCNSSKKGGHSPSTYCLELVRNNDHENFLCSLLLPNSIRATSFAIRAFNIEIAKIADQTKEKHIAAMRMQFWEDTLNKVYKGEPPQHPVALELHRVVKKHNLLKKQLKRLLVARASKFELTFDSINAMELYSEESVSPVYYLLLQALGSKSIDADHAASHIGKAQGLTNLLRSVPHSIAKSRSVHLPSSLLAKHNLSQESVIRSGMSDQLGEVVYEIASSAKVHLNKAQSLKDKVDKNSRIVFLPAVAVNSYLERLRHFSFDIFNPSLLSRNTVLGFKLYFNKILKKY